MLEADLALAEYWAAPSSKIVVLRGVCRLSRKSERLDGEGAGGAEFEPRLSCRDYF